MEISALNNSISNPMASTQQLQDRQRASRDEPAAQTQQSPTAQLSAPQSASNTQTAAAVRQADEAERTRDQDERARLYRNWKKAVQRTLDWVDEDVN